MQPLTCPPSLEALHFGPQGGPSLVITAALHGNEQTATRTARLVAQRLGQETLTGRVSILPVCNPTAFRARQRPAPEDNEDLNRIFPGDAQGGFSQQLAHQVWQLTEGFDYVLDLHCCGIYGHLYTMCWYSQYEFQRQMSRQLGIGTVIHTRGTGGQFYLESCHRRGQKALLIEMPGGQPGGVVHEGVAQNVCDKIINLLKLLGIVEGSGVLPPSVRFCGCIGDHCQATRDGFYSRIALPGQYVRTGDTLALLEGELVTSPINAVVTSASMDRYVFAGDSLLNLAPCQEVDPSEIPLPQ